jgi:hypothetical protein
MKQLPDSSRILLIAAVLLALVVATPSWKPAVADEGAMTISGEIVSVAYGPWIPFVSRRATLVIKTQKDKQFTVYVGHRTAYIPHRPPVVGDKVKVDCIKNQGVWAGTSVTYE